MPISTPLGLSSAIAQFTQGYLDRHDAEKRSQEQQAAQAQEMQMKQALGRSAMDYQAAQGANLQSEIAQRTPVPVAPEMLAAYTNQGVTLPEGLQMSPAAQEKTYQSTIAPKFGAETKIQDTNARKATAYDQLMTNKTINEAKLASQEKIVGVKTKSAEQIAAERNATALKLANTKAKAPATTDKQMNVAVNHFVTAAKPDLDRYSMVQDIESQLASSNPAIQKNAANQMARLSHGGGVIRQEEWDAMGSKDPSFAGRMSQFWNWQTGDALTPENTAAAKEYVSIIKNRSKANLENKVNSYADLYHGVGTPQSQEFKKRASTLLGNVATAPSSSGMVKVINPNGQVGSISADKLDAALKAGYKKAQ